MFMLAKEEATAFWRGVYGSKIKTFETPKLATLLMWPYGISLIG